MELSLNFCVLTAGYLIFHRTLSGFWTRGWIKERSEVVFFYFVINLIGVLLVSPHPVNVFIVAVVSNFTLFVSVFFIKEGRERRFRQHFPIFLERVIMFIKAGEGFRSAVIKAQADFDDHFQKKMSQIMDRVVFRIADSTKIGLSNFSRRVLRDFESADQILSSALFRLQLMRHLLRTEDDFLKLRRRAIAQVRAQIVIVSLLYMGILTFVIRQFPFGQVKILVLTSFTLFLCGIFTAIKVAGSFEWKV